MMDGQMREYIMVMMIRKLMLMISTKEQEGVKTE